MSMNIRGIIWDNESVLVSPDWNVCYDKAFELLGLEAPLAANPDRGKAYKEMLSVPISNDLTSGLSTFDKGEEERNFLQAYSSGHISASEFWLIACRHGFNLPTTSQNQDAIRSAQTFLLRDYKGRVRAIPEVVEVMNTLAVKLPQFMLSNTNPEIYEGFKDADYMKVIPAANRFFSIFLKCRKPSDQIYQMAIERTGLRAEQLLFIDDKQANIDGAKLNGIHGLLFNGRKGSVSSLIKGLDVFGIKI